MKKLFISVPMKGRTDEAIKNSIVKMQQMAEMIFGEELEVIHNHFDYPTPDGVNKSLYCLGFAIQRLSEADYFIGVHYTDYFKGCNAEARLAQDYNVRCAFVDMHDCAFLKDARDIENDYWNNRRPTCEKPLNF